MDHRRGRPSHHQVKYTIVLFGRKARLKELIITKIIENDEYLPLSSDCVLGESCRFRVINTPDIFDENNMYPDQHIIDCMALSCPGPHLFILVIDLDNTQEPKIVEQIQTLQTIFGNNVCQNLVVTLPDIESFQLFGHLKQQFNITLVMANENLANECEEWCVGRKPFAFHYNNYSKDVLMRRSFMLFKPRNNYHSHGVSHDARPENEEKSMAPLLHSPDVQRTEAKAAPVQNMEKTLDAPQFFNIILLGLTGTGKSASANTILTMSKPKKMFSSMSNSEPVTVKCECETVELYGTQLTVVDTPDFFHENVQDCQKQLEECRRYFVPGHYMVLLVLKVSRFTDEEKDILQKLEDKLDRSFRKETILLLTCGEDLKGKLSDFIHLNPDLKRVAEQCGYRSHLFNNKKNKSKQVRKLIKKFPEYEKKFPKIYEKPWHRIPALQLTNNV